MTDNKTQKQKDEWGNNIRGSMKELNIILADSLKNPTKYGYEYIKGVIKRIRFLIQGEKIRKLKRIGVKK